MGDEVDYCLSTSRALGELPEFPLDGVEMASNSVLRVKDVSGNGKIRDGGPADDKKRY